MMEKSSLTEDGNYRAKQEHEEARAGYIYDLIIRIRTNTATEDDAKFLEHELTPHLTHTRK